MTAHHEIRYGMVMDTRKCVGCNACVLACKSENGTPDGFTRDWIVSETRGKFPVLSMEIRSERCNHCEDAPCVGVCPTGASYVGEGGIVLVDHDKCTGCKACIAACPYDARFINPTGYADKCTFCHHRVAEGKDPACVTVCPTESLHFGDLADPDSVVSILLDENASKVLIPEAGTRPKLFFLT
jgi:Fe-S-cluster-containing dehydrogenase component